MAHSIKGAARRGGRALRSVGPATVAVAIALIIGAAGFADAATGGDFLLGKTNTENATAVMTDSTGVPLSLNAPSGHAPLSVNSTLQVNRLNAQYVGGQSAKKLESNGGVGITAPAVDTPLPHDTYVDLASTGTLPAGTYYVSATAMVAGESGTVFCLITGPVDDVPVNWGGGYSAGYLQAAETTVVTVPDNSTLTQACYGEGTDQTAYDAAITAIRIDSSSAGTVPSVLPQHIIAHHDVTGPPRS